MNRNVVGMFSGMRHTTDAAQHLFTEELILPSQFYAPNVEWTKDQRLKAATLKQAFEDLRLVARTKRSPRPVLPAGTPRNQQRFYDSEYRHAQRLALEAELMGWFVSDDREWPCSFLSICEALDIEPTYILQKLRACNWDPPKPPPCNDTLRKRRYVYDFRTQRDIQRDAEGLYVPKKRAATHDNTGGRA